MNAWQRSREDDGFRQALRDMCRATPQVVTLTDADVRKVRWAAERRKQGLPSQIRDATVIGRVVSLIRRADPSQNG